MTLAAGPVLYNIFVNKQAITETPLDVSLQQEWCSHDLFTVRIEFNKSREDIRSLPLWPDNAPVQIDWGRSPSINTWYGYVNHHTITGNAGSGSGALQIEYTLIGTSKLMNSDVSQNWGQVTGTYIAKTIAQKYGMRAVLTSSSWILPYEVQANESDFAFLSRIANKIGYRFMVSGGTLYFIDPAVVLNESSKVAVPIFYMDKIPGQLDTIRQFDMNQGGNLPGATLSNRSMYGIDSATGSVFQVGPDNPMLVGAPANIFSQINSGLVSNNLYEATKRMNAQQSLSQWWISASAEVYGSNQLYPGKLIFLQGRQLPFDGQGYWIVSCATQLLRASTLGVGSQDRNITKVELLRNSTATVPVIKNYNNVNPEFVTCRIQNGVWISNDTSVIYDGVA